MKIIIIVSLPIDTGSKLWNFSIDDYQDFISKVASLEPQVMIASLPSFVLKVYYFLTLLRPKRGVVFELYVCMYICS